MPEYKFFPGIDHLLVQHYGVAKDIFHVLTRHGLIKELSQIYQIGSLHELYTSRHRRDEYVELQIALVVRLRQLTDKDSPFPGLLGISTSKRNIFPFTASRAEIIQSLILLHNIGHISGTFACEAGLLQVLHEDKGKRSIIRRTLPTQQSKLYFDQLLKNFDVMSFHKIISYLKISGLRFDQQLKQKCYQIFDWYLNPSRPRDIVDEVFRKCRLLSFMYLDLRHSSVPFNLPLDQVIKSWEKNLPGWFSRESSISNFISSMHVEISRHLYHRNETAPFKNTAFKHSYSYFSGLDSSLSELRKGIKNYYYSENPRGKHICLAFETKDLQTAIRAKNFFLLYQNAGLFIERTNSLENTNILVSFCTKKNQQNVSFPFRSIALLLNSFIEDKEVLQPERLLQDILLNVLHELFDCSIEGYIKQYDSAEAFLINKGAKRSAKKLRNKIKTFKSLDEDRKHQLKILADAIEAQNFRGYVVALLGEIDVINKQNNRTATDIDGIALLVNKHQLSVLITEAKNKNRNAQAQAVRDLQRMFQDLGIKTTYQIVQIPKGAWTLVH